MVEMRNLDDAPLVEDHEDEQAERSRWFSLRARSARRALLLTALGGLLIAGTVTALPIRNSTALSGMAPSNTLGSTNPTFDNAKSGDCLNWSNGDIETVAIIDCKEDHRFEVAEIIDLRVYPGSEFGPDADPPSPARIQQITVEHCQPAVERYLGPKFDPTSRFSTSMVWPGEKAWRHSGQRRLMCGLQLQGPVNQQLPFAGRAADLDQSMVWPAGTCLGIDPLTNQPNDLPVDCATPHAMEVTGTVNLAEKFPAGMPLDTDQDAFIKDLCTSLTDAYLAPVELRDTTLTLAYKTVTLPSWAAGSRQVSCNVGATLGNGGWATLINSAKGPLLVNGQPPAPPPPIPEERLNPPTGSRPG